MTTIKKEKLGGTRTVYRCSDCRRWADEDDGAGAVRHSSRCSIHDHKEASVAEAETTEVCYHR